MSLLAAWMYRVLAWKERRRAASASFPHAQQRFERESPELGARGETLAYWYLRQAGYTVVARNWRARSGGGELDLVAWEGPTLAFVEVKTRTSLLAGFPEEAVTSNKQIRVIKGAKAYLQQLKRQPSSCRFDVVSVSLLPAKGLEVRLIKNAFRA